MDASEYRMNPSGHQLNPSGHQLTPEELMKFYPFLDEMLASTLLKMSQQGKLERFLAQEAAQAPQATLGGTLVGAIKVEPQEKSLLEVTDNGKR